jgi:hypothetical protein
VSPRDRRAYCPRCRAAYEPLQEYCLECGARLPTNRGVVGTLAAAWQRRFAWYPGDWIWPVLAFLVLTIVATAAAVAAASTKKSAASTLTATSPHVSVGPAAPVGSVPVTTVPTVTATPQPTITTGPLPTAPGETTANAPPSPPPVRTGVAGWPAGKSGYTDVLESIPLTAGRPLADARARTAAREGLPTVGLLVSSDYASLHPGYYVVFSGIYGSSADATAALAAAHADGWTGAYQVRVTR